MFYTDYPTEITTWPDIVFEWVFSPKQLHPHLQIFRGTVLIPVEAIYKCGGTLYKLRADTFYYSLDTNVSESAGALSM